MRCSATLLAGLPLGLIAAWTSPVAGGDLEVGRITGELRFPSCERTAPGLEVCAQSLSSEVHRCTTEFEDDGEALTYALQLPPGRYVVFARTPFVRNGRYRAYYSEAVRCGLEEQCRDHAPIPVKVVAGRVQSGIHPSDWVRGFDDDDAPQARLTN